MRLAMVAALLLAGCAAASPEVAECESEIKGDLRSPSTYDRVEAKHFTNPPDAGKIAAARKRFDLGGVKDEDIGIIDVFIHYDAANVYGTPIRSLEHCQWLTVAGKNKRRIDPTLSSIETEEEIAETRRIVEASIAEEESKPVPPPPPKKKASLCWQDYCPCDPPQGGPDEMLCRRLKGGLPVDDETMSLGAGLRDARRQIEEFDY